MEKCVDSPTHFSALPLMENCLFVRADAVKFLLKRSKNWNFISPQMLSIYLYIYLFYTTMGSIVPAGSPLSNGRNVREPQELRRDANPKRGGV